MQPRVGQDVGQDVTDRVAESSDDAHLARLASGGDRTAAARLVDRYQPTVRGFLRRLTGDGHLADDLTQETLFRMLRHAHAYDPKHAMKTWLLTIARRLWIDHLRRNARREVSTLEQNETGNLPAPHESAALAEQREQLDRALDQLSEAQRCAVTLFYQQEMSVEQIAVVMQMPQGTVKSHLFRARERLRQLMGVSES